MQASVLDVALVDMARNVDDDDNDDHDHGDDDNDDEVPKPVFHTPLLSDTEEEMSALQ